MMVTMTVAIAMTLRVVVLPVLPVLSLLPVILLILTSSLEKRSTLDRVVHHCFEGLIGALLDREHRIIAYLGCGIPERVRVLQRHKGLF